MKECEKIKIMNTNYNDKEKRLKEIEKIPLYTKGKGVCIGNMVSQIVATFYLDEIDKFIQNELKIKAYRKIYGRLLLHA